MVHDVKSATCLPKQKKMIFFVKIMFLLVFDQRLSLRSTEILKVIVKLHFLKNILYATTAVN